MTAALAVSTHAMFDILIARWCAAPGAAPVAPGTCAQHMVLARQKLQDALGSYLPWMSAADVLLYDRLLRAQDADELSDLYFRCFDLMVRTRGTAKAVLSMHELFRLLQPHITR